MSQSIDPSSERSRGEYGVLTVSAQFQVVFLVWAELNCDRQCEKQERRRFHSGPAQAKPPAPSCSSIVRRAEIPNSSSLHAHAAGSGLCRFVLEQVIADNHMALIVPQRVVVVVVVVVGVIRNRDIQIY